MKANELRIGSLVFFDGKIAEIKSISETGCWATSLENKDEQMFTHDLSIISPIPLTEEWLLKFGFIKSEGLYENYYIKVGNYYYSVQLREVNWFYSNDKSDAACYIVADFEYVNQLQNLHFALTQRELKIKE